MSASMSANLKTVENNTATNKINFDSINKANNIKLLEISPLDFKDKIANTSKLKKTVVIFWASWCSYCPDLIKIMTKLESEQNSNFKLFLVSIDKPNEKGKTNLLMKSAQMKLHDTIYIGNVNNTFDISNSKSIYEYLPKNSNFESNPGFPHIIIFENNDILFEDSGFDERYGISKFISLLEK